MIKFKDIRRGQYYYEDFIEKDNTLIKVMSIAKQDDDSSIMIYRYVDKTDGHWCVKEDQYYIAANDGETKFNLKLYDLNKKYEKEYDWLGGKMPEKISKYKMITKV